MLNVYAAKIFAFLFCCHNKNLLFFFFLFAAPPISNTSPGVLIAKRLFSTTVCVLLLLLLNLPVAAKLTGAPPLSTLKLRRALLPTTRSPLEKAVFRVALRPTVTNFPFLST